MEGTAWVGAGAGVLEWMERRSVCTGVNWGTTEEGEWGGGGLGGGIEKEKRREWGEEEGISLQLQSRHHAAVCLGGELRVSGGFYYKKQFDGACEFACV